MEISISVQPDELIREKLFTRLSDLNILGIKEENDFIYCYFHKYSWSKENSDLLKNILNSFSDDIVQLFEIREIPETNWNKNWENSIKPIKVGKNFIITPTWHKVNSKNKIVLNINPKMSFGTGYHETTRLMLEHLEVLKLKNKTLLDVGTGTGILAIAASKLGANKIVALDIDEWSIMNTKENIKLNNCAKCIKVFHGKLLECKHKFKYDVLLCNIFKNTILELLPSFSFLLNNNGSIILSGFIKSDFKEIKTNLLSNNYKLELKSSENDWICITAIKK